MLVALVVSVALNIGLYRHISSEVVTSDTIRTSDTVYVEQKDSAPSVKDEKVTGFVLVPTAGTSSFHGGNLPDTMSSEPFPDRKTDSVMLPVVQKRYSDDSTYTAYVSGVKVDSFPHLDSIIVRQRTITQREIITNTVMQKRSHWHFGIGTTAGLSLTTGQPDITAGFFAGYTF